MRKILTLLFSEAAVEASRRAFQGFSMPYGESFIIMVQIMDLSQLLLNKNVYGYSLMWFSGRGFIPLFCVLLIAYIVP